MKPLFRLLAVALLACAWGAPAGAAELKYPIDQVLGRADAPITIIEYASTTCPHCAHFHKTTLPRIKADWIETGKAKLIYRDFPTGPRGLSVGASMIAHCAGSSYFGLLGMLMEQQDKWMSSKAPLDDLKKLARVAGLGEDKVDACIKRQDLADAIDARARDAIDKLGIESTPSFLINGKLLVGAQSYDEFDKALKAAK